MKQKQEEGSLLASNRLDAIKLLRSLPGLRSTAGNSGLPCILAGYPARQDRLQAWHLVSGAYFGTKTGSHRASLRSPHTYLWLKLIRVTFEIA